MSRNPQSGVTLIEILIAVSLLSLLSVGMLTAMHLGLSTMERTDSRLVKNRRVVNARNIVESEIDGFRATNAILRLENGSARYVAFLQAEPQTMRFVTTYSLEYAWRGGLRVAALQVIPGEKNEGVRLIVDETPYLGGMQAGTLIAGIEQDSLTNQQLIRYAPVVPGPHSFVIADRLRYCRFWYLEQEPAPALPAWHRSQLHPAIMPLGVRVEMESLDNSGNDLHVDTVTLKFPVDSIPGGVYADGQ